MKNKLFFIIKTNSYVGNFERELMAYVFGYDNCDEYADHELAIFNEEAGDNLRDEFLNYLDVYTYGRSYSEYSCFKTGSHPTNEKYNHDSIYIGLNKKFPNDLCKTMLKRLKSFCEYHNNEKHDNLKILDVGYFQQKYVKESTLTPKELT